MTDETERGLILVSVSALLKPRVDDASVSPTKAAKVLNEFITKAVVLSGLDFGSKLKIDVRVLEEGEYEFKAD